MTRRRLPARLLPACAAAAVAAGLLMAFLGGAAGAQEMGPTISSVSISSSPANSLFYLSGETIRVSVNFTSVVEVGGSPTLGVDVGGNEREAAFESALGSEVLFAYTVTDDDFDGDGVSVGADKLSLGSGGAITDAGSRAASLTHVAVSGGSGHRVNMSVVTIAADSDEPVPENETAGFTVSRTGSLARELTVSLRGERRQYFVYTGQIPRMVTLEAGQATVQFEVPLVNDSDLETVDGSLTMIVAEGLGYLVGSPGSAVAVLTDDNDILLEIVSSTGGHIIEGLRSSVSVGVTVRNGSPARDRPPDRVGFSVGTRNIETTSTRQPSLHPGDILGLFINQTVEPEDWETETALDRITRRPFRRYFVYLDFAALILDDLEPEIPERFRLIVEPSHITYPSTFAGTPFPIESVYTIVDNEGSFDVHADQPRVVDIVEGDVLELGLTAVSQFRFDPRADTAVGVDLEFVDGTASHGDDFVQLDRSTATTETVEITNFRTIGVGDTERQQATSTVRISAVDNDDVQPVRQFVVNVGKTPIAPDDQDFDADECPGDPPPDTPACYGQNHYLDFFPADLQGDAGLSGYSMVVRIHDDDATPVAVTANESSIDEGGDAVFTVTRNPSAADLPDPLTVGFDITETADFIDYSGGYVLPASVTIAGNATTATITIPTVDDNVGDGPGEVVATLRPGTVEVGSRYSYTLAGRTASVAVSEDEPVMTIAAASVSESAGTVDLDVTLSGTSAEAIGFTWATVAGSGDDAATAGQDYQSAGGTVEIDAGDTSATLTVMITDDALDEPDETFAVVLSAVTGASVAQPRATVTVTDNDDPPAFSIADAAATEGPGAAVDFTVSLDAASGRPTEVAWRAVSDEDDARPATEDVDYQGISATLTIPPGDTQATISVQLLDDGDHEPTETFEVRLADPANSTIADATGEGRILDDDTPVISIDDLSVSESAATAQVRVSLSRPAYDEVSLRYGTAAGTAIATSDYTARSRVAVTVPAGDTTATVSVPILADDVYEADEFFFVDLSDPTLAALSSDIRALITIVDDDSPPTLSVGGAQPVSESAGPLVFTVTRTGATSLPATFSWSTADVTAEAGSDYTAESGTVTIPATMSTAQLSVTVLSDSVAEDDETVAVTLSSPINAVIVDGSATGVIEDDDQTAARTPGVVVVPSTLTVTEGGDASYTVALSSQPAADVTVAITGHSGTDLSLSGTSLSSNDTLTFTTANWNAAQTVTVSAGGDDDAVADAAVALTHTATSGSHSSAPVAVTVTITETDTAAVVVLPAVLMVAENGSGTYTVRLATQPSANVTVTVTGHTGTDLSLSGTGLSSNDTLSFTTTNWNTAQTVTVSAAPDADGANDRVALTNTAGGGGYGAAEAAIVAVTVTDDDSSTIVVTPPSLTMTEGGGSSYTVELSSPPTADVTVTVSAPEADLTLLSVGSRTLRFTPSDWDRPQTVTLAAGYDADTSDDVVTLTHTGEGGGYDGQSTALPVTVTDAEGRAELLVVPTSISVREGASRGQTYSVALGSQPTGDVTVTISGHAGTDLSLSGTSLSSEDTLTFTTADWNAAQTVTVTAAGDADTTNDDVTLTNTATGGGYGTATAVDVAVTVVDNDAPALVVTPTEVRVTEGDGAGASYEISLASRPPGLVQVSISANSTAGAHVDGVWFTTSDWRNPQTITVTAGDDPDLDDEQVSLNHTVTFGTYAASAVSVRVIVEDDDVPGLAVNPPMLSVIEGASATYDVELTAEPSADVTVAIAGHAGTDLTLSGTGLSSEDTLTFTTGNWNQAQPVTATLGQDSGTTDDAAVTLTHTASGGGYDSLEPVGVLVTLIDDDRPRIDVPAAVTVTEGASAGYDVRLAVQPSANVTVTIGGHSGSAVTVSGDTLAGNALTFTTGNWSTAQEVSVTGRDDDDTSNESAVLTHTAAGGDYAGLTAQVAVTVVDDDEPEIILSDSEVTVDEADPDGAVYEVRLATEPSQQVGVEIVGALGTDLTLDPEILTFDSSTWDTVQAVKVTASPDVDAMHEEEQIAHFGSGGEYDGTTKSVTVIVQDGDIPPGVTVSPTSLSITEGSSDTYTVELTAEPTGDVVVEVAGHVGGGVVTVDGSSSVVALTFTTASWNTAQTVTVAAADDDVDDGEVDVSLTHAVKDADSAAEYAGVAGESVTVTVADNDTAGVTVSPVMLGITEGASDTYTVVLTSEPTGDVVVEVAGHTTGGVVTVDGSSAVVALTFTTASWNTAQTVTVAAADDDVDDGDVGVSLTHAVKDADSAAEYAGVTGESVAVTVADNDTAGVTVSPMMLDITEGASGSYTVELTAEPTADVVVEVAGHATGGDVTVDGSASAVLLTFTTGSWNTAQTVTVAAVDDGVTEGEESVTLTHGVVGADSAAEYVGVAGESVIVTVTDPAGVSVSPTSLSITEGSSGSYEVVLTAEPTSDVVVEVDGHTTGGDVTVDGSASAVLLTFTTGSWNTAQTVTVAAVDDGVTEGEESVTLTHGVVGADSAAEYVGVAGESVIVTVTDPAGVSVSPTSLDVVEGASGTYEVVLTAAPTADVVVEVDGHTTGGDVTVDGSASAVLLTFTTGSWNTAQTVTVAAVADGVTEGEESVTLTHGVVGADSATEYVGVAGESVIVTVTDPAGVSVSPTSLDVVEGASGTYEVVLTAEPTSDVVVEVDGHTTGGDVTVDGSASAVLLTFTTGSWNTAQTVTVAAVDDGVTEGEESVTLTHGVVGADSATEYVGVAGESVIVTVTDPAGVSVSPTSLDVVEGASGTYEVVLTAAPTSDVVVEVDGHAGGGDVTVDGSASAVLLTFTTGSWNTAQTVTVAAVDDGVTEGEESVTLTHGVVGADSATEYVGVAGESVIVTVTDPAGVSVSPTSLDVVEGSSDTYTYTVVLTAEPTADVVVEIDGHTTGGDVTVDGSSAAVSLTFTTGTWNTAQTVTVAAVDDGVTEGEESVTLTHAVTDADSAAEYAGVTGESVIVTVTDPAGVTVSPTSLDVVEGSSDTYTVELTAEPTGDVVVEIDGHTTGGVVTVDGSSSVVALTFTTGDWNTAQTVTVAAVDNSVAGGEESVSLTHAVVDADSATEYAGVTGESVAVTVTDDETAGVTVSPTTLNITEGASGTYTVVLTSEPTGDVVVEIDGHTTGGVVTVDGSSSVVALTFTTGDWNTAQTVTVAAVDNSVADGEESVSLTHAVVDADSATEYAGVTGESVAVTVTDNDSAGVTVNPTSLNITEGASDTYTVVLTAEPTGDVVVEISGHTTGGVVTVDGSSSAVALTFTTGTWNTAQTVTVAAVDDSTAGGTESVSLTHAVKDADSATEYAGVTGASVAVTVTDNDSAGVTVSPTSLNITEGASDTYTVVLTSEPTADVVVEIDGHTTGGVVTVDGSSSVVALTFTTGDWNTAQTVTVAAVDNSVAGGEESVSLTHAVVDADSATEYAGVTGESVAVTVTDDETAGVTVSPTTLNITEGASGTYTVVLTSEPTGDVVVEIDGHTTGGVVTVDGSSSVVALTFTTGDWNTAQTVTVAAVDNSVADGEESVSLTHAVVDADSATEYAGVTGESVAVTVTDNDSAGVTVNPTSLNITEGASDTYTVVLTAEPTADVVVEISGHTTGGVVTVDGSSSAVALTFTTGTWNTAQTVTVAAVDNSVAGGEESVSLTHAVVDADSATEYAGVTGESVAVTVTDDETAGVTVNPTTLNITEGASGTYTVVLTSEPTGDVVVEIDGHTTGGVVTVDGSSSVVALTFTTGTWNTAQTVTVAAVDNSVADGEESVSLTHAVVDADSATEYAGVTGESVAVTVTDNDSAGVTVNPTSLNITEGASDTYTVVLTAEPTGDVVVEIAGHVGGGVVTVDGSSSAVSLTFTTGTWNTAQTVTVAAVDDSTAGGTESVSLTHAVKDADSATEYAGVTGASVAVTVTDNDSAGVTVSPTSLNITEGASGTYTVVLTSEPTGDVVVEIDGHTTGGVVTVDGSSSSVVALTFTTGTWNTAQTVTVAAVDNSVAGGEESVSLTHAVVDADSATEYAGVTGESVAVTVTDDETAGVTVSPTSLNITEGASGTYTVVLTSEPTGDVVVEIAGHVGGGVVTVDGSSSAVSLTFTTGTWNTAQTVTVAAVDDSTAGGTESVSLTHAVVDADSATEYAGVTGASVAVTVTDNDSAGVTVSPTSLNITEGASGTYTVVLTSEPTGDVVVEIDGHTTGGVVTVDGSSSSVVALTFTTGDWNTAQTVTVAAVDDSTAGGTESVSLTHAVKDADSATEYAGVTGESVAVTVTDDETAGVTVSPTSLNITEGASGSYTVVLTSEPTGDVVVEIDGHTTGGVVTVDGSSSSVVALTFTTGTWNTAQTVTVAAVDNSVADGEESVSLTHAVVDADSAAEYAGVAGESLTVTVTDDDTAGVTVSPTSLGITEGASGSYTVVLTSEPTADVVVEIDGHTTDGVVTVDGSSSVVSLTFTTASWNTAQTVTVAAVDDSTAGGTESVSLTHAVKDADSATEYAGVTGAPVTVTVTDNDSAGVTVNPMTLNITEGASGSYTVELTSEPTGDVVVEIGGHTTGGVVTVDGSSSVVALTFTTASWNTAQTVTVAAVDDSTAGGTESVSLTHTITDADSAAEYRDVTVASVAVTVTDNDSAGVTVSFEKDFHRTSEGASGAFATVRLSAAPQQAVTIPINVSSTTTAEANDYRLSTDPFQDDPNYAAVPTSGTFDVTFEVGDSAAYFAIRALPDTVFENDETVVLEFGTLPTGVSTGSPSATTFHLIDTQTASFGAASYSATEGGPGATVTVNLDYAVSAIVCLEVENHAGTSDGDYAGVPDDLIFAGTETSRSFVVTVADDADSEGGSITISLGCLSGELREGSPSSTTVTLLDYDPPGGNRDADGLPAPRGFTATYATLNGNNYNKTQDSVTLLWWPLDRAVRYKLEYRRTAEGGDWSVVAGDFEEYTGGGNGPVAVAAGLECDTEYDFRLSAAGAEDTDVSGFGAYAETGARTGPCPKSALVTNILVATTPACATLHWTAPLDGRAAAYRVRRTDLGQEPAVTTTLAASAAGTTFRHCPPGGYPPGSGYLFWVAALTADGEVYGEHNSQIEATGPKGPPSVARNLRFTRQSPQVRSLAWDPPVNHWLTTVSEATDGDGYSNEVADPWVSYVVQRGELEPGSVPGHETLVDGTWRDLGEVTGTTFTDRENIGGRIFVYRVLAKNLNGFAVGYHPEIWMERPTTSLQRRDAPDVGGLQESDTPPQLQTAEFQENSEVPALPPLTAGYRDAPVSHDGQNSFTFELRFSEEVELSYVTLRDEAFRVTGGTVITARRLNSPSNIRWRIEIQPAPDGDVTVLLPGTTDCGAEGAVCTEDGSKLSNGLALVVSGPA